MPMNDDKQSAMKARDYYNQARDEMIAELTKLQNEAFERYDKIKGKLKTVNNSLSDEKQLEMLRSQLFGGKFAFIVEYECQDKDDQKRLKRFHLVVVDFYLNENSRELLR